MADSSQPKWGVFVSKIFPIPQRWMMTIFGCTSLMNCYTMRYSLDLSMPQLARSQNRTRTQYETDCQINDAMESTFALPPGEYKWDYEMQSFILSSIYIGYAVSHMIGGILSDMYGSKWILFGGMMLSSILSLLTPTSILYGGAYALITLRIIVGLAQGLIIPALSTLLAHWAPPQERASLGAIMMGGGTLGQAIVSITSTLLSYYQWPFVFLTFGFLGLVWCLFFGLMGFSDPSTHPFIRQSEREYIETERGVVLKNSSLRNIPWGAIFTSCPTYALAIVKSGHNWGLQIITSNLPQYFKDVLRFDISTNGLVLAAPFICMWICSLISGFVSDGIRRKKSMSITTDRKIMTMIAQIGPGIFMVIGCFLGCNKYLNVIMFCVAMALMGPYFSGPLIVPVDMSPNFAGVLMSITNGIGHLAAVPAPYLVDNYTLDAELWEWRVCFLLTCILLLLTGIVFYIWGDAEVQPWNEPKNTDEVKG